MKKRLSCILTILFLCILAQLSFANDNITEVKNIEQKSSEEIREQSKILYMGNQYELAKKNILSIPDTQKIAFDYYLIGLTTKDTREAIKAYESAIALDEKFYQAYFNIANLYFSIQNYEKAVDNYKLAVKHNKDFAYGHYNLGCTYLVLEEYNNARKSFEKAIKINPKEPDYYHNLGFSYKKLGNKKRADKAISLYNELMKERVSD